MGLAMWKILLLCVAAVPLFAARISFGPRPFELSIVDSTGTLLSPDTTSADVMFPQFDPALGRLTGVAYSLRSSARWLELTGRGPAARVSGTVLAPGLTAPTVVFLDGGRCRGLCVPGEDDILLDMPDVAIYSGTAMIAAVLSLSAGRAGPRRENLTVDAAWPGEVSLTYSYEPEIPAPEPGTLALALLGLACVLRCQALLRDTARRGSGGGARRGRRSYRRGRGP